MKTIKKAAQLSCFWCGWRYEHNLNLFFFEWIATTETDTTERREVIEHYKLRKQFFKQLEQSPQIKKNLY